jgi:hypothetical protein
MNTEPKTKEEVFEVTEEKDGSVVVELPEGMATVEMAEGGEAPAQEESGDEDQPGDTDAIREARRARRRAKKEYIKRTNEEKDQRLTLLQRQNQELMERLAAVERKTHTADLARLDSAIADEEARLEFFKRKMREATDNSDGNAFMQAQEGWYEARRKVEAMQGIKQRAVQATNNEAGPANPRLVKLANQWMERNSWYDPNGGDEDSQIAKLIDNRLASEGWDPATEEYWDEFDKRLQARLPNRYTHDQDEQPRRKPRSFVTGSSRESSAARGSGNTFVLEPEQVRAMKEAGLWDDPATRNRMIKRYAEQARNNRG